MLLSEEQKERIIEEERRKLAEEEYREQVRRELRNPPITSQSAQAASVAPQFASPPPSATAPAIGTPTGGYKMLKVLGAVVFFFFGLFLVIGRIADYASSHPHEASEVTNFVQRRKSIITTPFTVPPLQKMVVTFEVHEPATLLGSVEIFGGSRDVAVSVTDVRGGTVFTLGRMYGQGNISYPIPIGQYRLVFDNGFSLRTPKSVTPNIALEF